MGKKQKKQHQILIQKFLENCRQMNRSPHTIKNYQLDLEKFMLWYEAIHRTPLHKASAQTITQYNHFLKHGGEISKQLMELADSVMMQRQVQIEAKITALPVKATGPLVCVFAGFFALLFAGLFVRLMSAFGS